MRTIRPMGTQFSGKHIQFLPAGLDIIPTSSLAPMVGSTPGEWATRDPLDTEAQHYLCVNRGSLADFFGRVRIYETLFEVTGEYEDDSGVHSFSVGPVTGSVDVVLPTFEPDERFLPHGLVYYIFQGTVVVITPGRLTVGYGLSLSHRNSSWPCMDPTNTVIPQRIFDADAFFATRVVPWIVYDETLDAFYVALNGPDAFTSEQIGFELTVQWIAGTGDPDEIYTIGWKPSYKPLGQQDFHGSLVDNVSLGDYALQLTPMSSIPGYIYAPEGVSASIDTFTMSVTPASTGAFFEYRDRDGNNPIWDIDTGAQLITPVPMTM